jgi:hypothetical protein
LLSCVIFRRIGVADEDPDNRTGKIAGFVAALTFACFVPEWLYVYGFASEPLFTLLLFGALGLTMVAKRASAYSAAGILFGMAVLTRPALILFPVLLVGWMVLGRGVPLRRAVLVPLLMLATLAPWGIRNYQIFQTVIVTATLKGYNLFRHNYLIEGDDYIRYVSKSEGNEKIMSLLASRGLTPSSVSEQELDGLLSEEAHRVIRMHPWRYANLVLHRLVWSFTDGERDIRLALRLAYVAFFVALFGLHYLALRRYSGGWVKKFAPVWLLLAYVVVLHAFIVSQFRYVVPLIPLLLTVSAYALVRGYGDVCNLVFNRRSVFRYESNSC